MEKGTKEIKKNFNHVEYPFIKLKINTKQIFNRGFEKSKDEIDYQTQKLISCCNNYKFKTFKKKEGNHLTFKIKNNEISSIRRPLSLYYINPENNTTSSSIINSNKLKINNKKEIFEYNYLLLKERYKNYINKLKEKEENKNNHFNLSENNKYEQNLSFNNNSKDFTSEKKDKYFSPIIHKNIKIQKIKLSKVDENKNNNNKSDLFSTNINDLHFSLKNKKEKFSKINLILKETNDKKEEIKVNLNKFSENIRKSSPKILRNLKSVIFKDIMDNKSEINRGNQDNNIKYTKINLTKNKNIKRNNYSFIKKSTADLVKFWQSLELMPDEHFYRERKRFIKKYPLLQKEANLIYKSQGNEIDLHQKHYNDLVEDKIKKINNLADNNLILFNKILKDK